MARLPVARAITNIGTTAPTARPLTERAPRFLPGGAAPIALPVAEREGEGTGQRVVAPFPLWEGRWQPSRTPPNRPRPWVTGYRFFHRDVAYERVGVIGQWRVDMMFQGGHQHWYWLPEHLWWAARGLSSSVGGWLHDYVLKPKAMIADGPL